MRRRRLLAAASAAALALAVTPGNAGTGDVERSFGNAGMSRPANFGGDERARAIAAGPGNRVTVAGTRYRYSRDGRVAHTDLVVARYRLNGRLDRSFAGNGKKRIRLTRNQDARGIAVMPDGGVAVVATESKAIGEPEYRVLVVRLTAAGARDRSFGSTGVVRPVMHLTGGQSTAAGVIGLHDGHIVIGGTTSVNVDLGQVRDDLPEPLQEHLPGGSVCTGGFTLVRLDTTGALDPTFGIGGRAQPLGIGSCDTMHAATSQPDGALVAVGTRTGSGGTSFLVTRFLSTGAPDLSFGVAGQTTWADGPAYGKRVAVASDGSLIVAGNVTSLFSSYVAVVRFTQLGEVDPSFADGGSFIRYEGRVGGVAVLPDGRAIVVVQEGGCFLLFCTWTPLTFALRPNGSFAAGFATKGEVRFPDRFLESTSVALHGDVPIIGGNHYPVCLWCLFFFTDRGPPNLALVRLQA